MSLGSENIAEKLVSVTIGSGKKRDPQQIAEIFKDYLELAVPGIVIHHLEPIITSVSLNSIISFVRGSYEDRSLDVVAKVHIESNTSGQSSISAAGAREYEQAALLSQYKWSVLAPLEIGEFNPEFPVLLYPRVDAPTLFSLLDSSNNSGKITLTNTDLQLLKELDQQIGKASANSIRIVPSTEANSAHTAPMQTLFIERLRSGSRIDQWYQQETLFRFPGLTQPISWCELLDKQWIINGEKYQYTLRDIINAARHYLGFIDSQKTAVCVCHGDDHAGNVFIDRKAKQAFVFDPAFAGWNPASFAHVKPFMHSGVLPAAGMYYNPHLPHAHYSIDKTTVKVEIDFEGTPIFNWHKTIAEQIVTYRFMPIFERLSSLGIDIDAEKERVKYALVTCCFLVINVSMLLENTKRLHQGENGEGGTGEGLFPLVFMCSELRGIPQLNYLRESLAQFHN